MARFHRLIFFTTRFGLQRTRDTFWKETTSVSAQRGLLRSGIRSMAPTRLNTYLVLVLLRDESRAYDVRQSVRIVMAMGDGYT
jgi:hypothetical protein